MDSRGVEYSRKWWALVAVGSGVLMATIDGSIVNISLNTLVDAFNSSLSAVEWVVLSYLLTITCLLLSMGRLGDIWGKRRVYLIGFVIFTIGSALCSLSPTIGALIGFRVLQGIGAAMLQAIGPALLVTAFPPQERGTALGATGSIVALGILLGPVLGGILLRYIGWQSIFYVNIPIGALGIWLSLVSLPADKPAERHEGFDYLGAILLLASLFGLLLGLTEAPSWGWTDWRIIGLLALFIVAGALFIFWEQHTLSPMLRLSIFRSASFSFSLLAALILFCSLSFNLLLMPFFLQLVRGFDQQATGFVLISLPIALSLASPISGRLSDRIGARGLTIAGLILIVMGLLGLAWSSDTSPLLLTIGFLVVTGAGIGLFQSPNNSTVMGNAPPEALGVAGGLLAVVRTLGQTSGIAIAGSVWSSRVTAIAGRSFDPITSAPPHLLSAGYEQAMIVAAIIAGLAIIPTLLSGRASMRSGASQRSQAHVQFD